jgi:hypothetical protein
MTQFYNYLWCDPKDGTPRYVGKGFDNRAVNHLHSRFRIGNLLRKRIKEGYACVPVIHYVEDEQTALEMEKFWIDQFGRLDLRKGTLFNLTDGGDGFTGGRHTAESKARIGAASKGNTHSVGREPWNKGIKTGIKTRGRTGMPATRGSTGMEPWNKGTAKPKAESKTGRRAWNSGLKTGPQTEQHRANAIAGKANNKKET